MSPSTDKNNPEINSGDSCCGYTVKRIERICENRLFYYELEHDQSGAGHIHISCDDQENTFGVALKTVPTDSTGVAHILEHTVLCGSDKYPVHDPFFSMLKRSLSTFMNAFTASDWTMYPFSTQNEKDYYNLMDVYLDAVFFPNIDELSFKQEGHRLELEPDPENPDTTRLTYKGIVYNEMKGAMSSPDQIMVRSLLKTMYPDTTYHFNSGGEPAEIPKLTYEELISFHKRHYHPSNAFFYTYGNIPLNRHLEAINEKVLEKFNRIDPQTEVPPQPRWTSPRETTAFYPLDKNEDPAKKSQASVAWLTTDIQDTFEVLALSLLEQILLGNSASPLKKALIEANIGTALSDGTGFDSDNRDTMFACGLKDVKADDAKKIEAIIFKVLNTLADEGIEKELIDSAIHQLEFHRKEITNTPYPYGIKILLYFTANKLHGGDPVKALEFDTDLVRLKTEIAEEPFFENRIRKYLLDNPHRVLFSMVPDQEMEQKESERTRNELAKINAGLSSADREKIIKDTELLKIQQEADEDISCLPTLMLSDIPPNVHCVKETETDQKSSTICYHQPTQDILYFTSAAGTGALDETLLPYVPFFCTALARVGTAEHDYTEIVRLIDAYTGGIGASSHARISFEENGTCTPFISINGKCLGRNQNKMFDILQEIIFSVDFSDLPRLKNLLLEYRAGMESMVVHNGHRLAISLASRRFSSTRYLSENWQGVHQLQFIKKITDRLTDASLSEISEKLSTIRKIVITENNLKMALVGEADAMPDALKSASSIFNNLKAGSGNGFTYSKNMIRDDQVVHEGWSTSSAVSFVARTFQTVRMAHKDAPALSVLSKLLRSMYLHREIREKGGAYGGFSLYNSEDGLFCFASYRDPHIVNTLNVFDGSADFIRKSNLTDEDVKEAVLQICSEIDKPDPPGPAARKAFYRKIISLSDEARLRFKESLLKVSKDQIIEVTEKYFTNKEGAYSEAIISGEEALNAANEKLKRPLELRHI
ncbi:MAG: insulinase family protein [Desulfobacterales bacterium]|nr:insulinase family protein [Desulfobacterales bacterium]